MEQLNKSVKRRVQTLVEIRPMCSLVSQLFGEHIWKKFIRSRKFLTFKKSIESAKRTLKETKSNTQLQDEFVLDVPKQLLKELAERESTTLDMAVRISSKKIEKLNGKVELKYGGLCFKADVLRQIMKESVIEILPHITTTVANVRSGYQIDAIVLVGGFALSHFMLESIRKSLKNDGIQIRVKRPPSCELAVLRGAVLYGQDERILSTRILRMTYGIRVQVPFKGDKHIKEDRKVVLAGKTYIKDVFAIHAFRDQSVNIDEWTPSKTYTPLTDDQTKMYVGIYSSDELHPGYTDDKSCREIGGIKVSFDTTVEDRSREVSFNFGLTEIHVRTENKTTHHNKIYVITLKDNTS